MKKIKPFLENNEIKTDNLGRFIVEDMSLLENINGALQSSAEFMIPDVGCGNVNCGC